MPSPALMGAEERGGPCLEEAVGVKQGSPGDPEEPRVSTEERCLGKTKLLSPDTCRAVLQQRGKTRSPKPELGLVGKQGRTSHSQAAQPLRALVNNLPQRVPWWAWVAWPVRKVGGSGISSVTWSACAFGFVASNGSFPSCEPPSSPCPMVGG